MMVLENKSHSFLFSIMCLLYLENKKIYLPLGSYIFKVSETDSGNIRLTILGKLHMKSGNIEPGFHRNLLQFSGSLSGVDKFSIINNVKNTSKHHDVNLLMIQAIYYVLQDKESYDSFEIRALLYARQESYRIISLRKYPVEPFKKDYLFDCKKGSELNFVTSAFM